MQFIPVPWNDDLEITLAQSAGADMACVRADVKAGLAKAYRVKHDDNGTDSWAVLRGDGEQLVVVCYEGRDLKHAAKAIKDIAAKSGFNEICFFTEHPALARLIADLKPTLVQYVYLVEV